MCSRDWLRVQYLRRMVNVLYSQVLEHSTSHHVIIDKRRRIYYSACVSNNWCFFDYCILCRVVHMYYCTFFSSQTYVTVMADVQPYLLLLLFFNYSHYQFLVVKYILHFLHCSAHSQFTLKVEACAINPSILE